MPARPEILDSIAPLAARYDAFVLDLWGTLHNGIAPLPGALDALAALRAAGKRIACLSNAPYRARAVADLLARIGIARATYDTLHTSGEEAWQALATRPDAWYRALGRRVLFVGASRHAHMLDNPTLTPVDAIGEAEFLLCTGPWDDDATLADFTDLLADAAARGLPMVCANPDRVVLRGTVRQICAGALAEHYETALGGDVRWHGKPNAAAFAGCLAHLGVAAPARAVMVGDSLLTDIAGARAAGLGAAFVAGGIYAEALGIAAGETPDAAALARLCAEHGVTPDTVVPAFAW